MKRPAFQFYAKDWRGNLKLRRCSDAAKGAWIEIMCVLHDSEEYGVARFPLKELVSAAGVQMKSAKELVEKGVLKGGDRKVEAYIFTPRHAGKAGEPVTLIEACDGPVWYCSRFVRDEHKRLHAGAETRFKPTKPPGGDPPNQPPSPRDGGDLGDGTAVAVASAVSSLNQHLKLAEGGTPQAVDNPGANAPTATHRSGNWRRDPTAADRKHHELFGKPSPHGKQLTEVVAIIDEELARRARAA